MSEKVELGMGRGQGKLLGDQGRRWRHILEGTGGGGVGRSAVLQTDLRKLGGGGGGFRGGRQWGLGEESGAEEGCSCCGGEGWVECSILTLPWGQERGRPL